MNCVPPVATVVLDGSGTWAQSLFMSLHGLLAFCDPQVQRGVKHGEHVALWHIQYHVSFVTKTAGFLAAHWLATTSSSQSSCSACWSRLFDTLGGHQRACWNWLLLNLFR